MAQGERRGYVAMDFRGEVYAIAKWIGLKTKDVRGKLGDAKELPTLEAVKETIATRMTDMLRDYVTAADIAYQKKAAELAFQKTQIVGQQRKERSDLEERQLMRWAKETTERASRLNTGFRGIWDRIIGKHSRLTRENERDALQSLRRDRTEKDTLIERHINDRENFHYIAKQFKAAHSREIAELHQDIARYMRTDLEQQPATPERSPENNPTMARRRPPRRDRDFER